MLAVVPSSIVASHGWPWEWPAVGTACHDDLGCFDATVKLRPAFASPGVFHVTLADPGTGLVLPDLRFDADQTFANLIFVATAQCRANERFDYRGFDESTGGEWLLVEGLVHRCMDEPFFGNYRGHLTGHVFAFALELDFVPD